MISEVNKNEQQKKSIKQQRYRDFIINQHSSTNDKHYFNYEHE